MFPHHKTLAGSKAALLVVPFPEPDGPWVRWDEDSAAQEGSQRGVENGSEQSL